MNNKKKVFFNTTNQPKDQDLPHGQIFFPPFKTFFHRLKKNSTGQIFFSTVRFFFPPVKKIFHRLKPFSTGQIFFSTVQNFFPPVRFFHPTDSS